MEDIVKKFPRLLEQVLVDEKCRGDKFLTEAELDTVLRDDVGKETPRTSIVGYPSYPLHREISNMLLLWLKQKRCPALDLPKIDLLDEKSYSEDRLVTIQSITPLLEGLVTLASMWCDEEIKYRIREILLLLGRRGILDLLGVRKTVGTKEIFPPSRTKLLESFTEKFTPNAILSVGARALSKHFHRDSTSWWGNCTGTEAAKNTHALDRVTKVIDNAIWLNIHWLPSDVYIIEMRQHEMYGARWSADGESFRGFLEPIMVAGYETGYRH